MAVLPPGYHIKCNFCDKTEGPFPTVDKIEDLIVDPRSGWMELRFGGEEIHCCGSDHFQYDAQKVLDELSEKLIDEKYPKNWKNEALEHVIRRGF